MDRALALRPFVPARDFGLPKRFYQALGFRLTHEADDVAMLELGGFSFILQDVHVPALAETLMLQLMVRDADTWWQAADPAALVTAFGVKPPRPPTVQPWGMKVGFVFDPSGVPWHVAEAVF